MESDNIVEALSKLKISLSNVEDKQILGEFAGSILDSNEKSIESMEDLVNTWDIIDSHEGEVISEILDIHKEDFPPPWRSYIPLGKY